MMRILIVRFVLDNFKYLQLEWSIAIGIDLKWSQVEWKYVDGLLRTYGRALTVRMLRLADIEDLRRGPKWVFDKRDKIFGYVQELTAGRRGLYSKTVGQDTGSAKEAARIEAERAQGEWMDEGGKRPSVGWGDVLDGLSNGEHYGGNVVGW
jgi:hypothetical protein